MLSGLGALAACLAYGTASALVPVMNAEAFAVLSGSRASPPAALLIALALAAGQTVGKLVLFEAARRGRAWATRLPPERKTRQTTSRTARWLSRVGHLVAQRRSGAALVFTSAALGMPPLAAVSLAAGTSGQSRWRFAAACLSGRTVRFAALVLPAALAASSAGVLFVSALNPDVSGSV